MEDDKKDDKNGMKGFKITDTFGFKEVSAPLYLDLNQNKFSTKISIPSFDTKISTPSELIYPSVNYGMLDFNNLSASPSLNKQIELEKTINSLKEELSGKILELKDLEKNDEKNKEKIKSLEATHEELVKKEELRYLLTRVNEKAKTKLLESDDFKKLFDDNKICDVVVMAIDIRRSTDLMLKAKTPTHYAEFITSLCKKLTDIICKNYGIFDKFTGDGILAFFPLFYSSPDAMFHALKSSIECHECFAKHYEENRRCFTTVLTEIGLGIGIDYGQAHLVGVNNSELTVVGTPVVYACRFSGADRGETLLNQSAYEETQTKYGSFCLFEKREINIKNEGMALAHKAVNFKFEALKIEAPDWDK